MAKLPPEKRTYEQLEKLLAEYQASFREFQQKRIWSDARNKELVDKLTELYDRIEALETETEKLRVRIAKKPPPVGIRPKVQPDTRGSARIVSGRKGGREGAGRR